MGRHRIVLPPSVAPSINGDVEGEDHWRSFDNSVNAVSFGFVATAILISMFLVMAIFERFLRRRSSSSGGRNSTDLAAQMRVQRKLDYPSPEMTFYANGVSVLMPGEEVPTFIAHPVPAPSSAECISQPILNRTCLQVQPQLLVAVAPVNNINNQTEIHGYDFHEPPCE